MYCYDKETEENSHYNKGNKLSDVTVTNIYYNATKKYLVVVYDNANIDIIENSGKVINMPDIKNAEINADKSINDITFATGAAYVATDFGYVVINDAQSLQSVRSMPENQFGNLYGCVRDRCGFQ